MTLNSNLNCYKICDSISDIDFSENGLAELEIEGKKICIGKFNDRLFACPQKCPHAGGLLNEGYLDMLGNLVCPLHQYKFNTQNGRNISGEGYFLRTFVIEVRDDGVYIDLTR